MTPVAALLIIIPLLTTVLIIVTGAWVVARSELRDWDRYVVVAAARRVEEARREAQYFKELYDDLESEDLRDQRTLRKLQIQKLSEVWWSSDLEAAPRDKKQLLVWHPSSGLHLAYLVENYWRSANGSYISCKNTQWAVIIPPEEHR